MKQQNKVEKLHVDENGEDKGSFTGTIKPEEVVLMPHQKRMVTERNQLQDKITKLADFIGHNKLFLTLSETQKELLREQCECMCGYLEVLETRVSAEVGDAPCDLQNKVEHSHIQNLTESLEFKFARVEETGVTGCWSYLPGGFKIGYGESLCVDWNNYDREKGEKYSKERCIVDSTNKLWELEGYLLKITGKTSDSFKEAK